MTDRPAPETAPQPARRAVTARIAGVDVEMVWDASLRDWRAHASGRERLRDHLRRCHHKLSSDEINLIAARMVNAWIDGRASAGQDQGATGDA